MLAPLRRIFELVGRRRDLPARRRLAPSAGTANAFRRLLGPAARDALAQALDRHAARRAVSDERSPQRVLIEEPPTGLRASQTDALAGSERIRIADVALERDESALAREDVLVGRLDVPQRAQPERVDAEETGVADAREERCGTLRERTERGARLHVQVLQLRGHALDLVDDRREEQLDRLDRA